MIIPENMNDTLTLVDLSGIFWAHWHATADQALGEAVRRTVDTVKHFAPDPSMAVVCIDSPPYFRKEIAPEYKAQRDAPEPQAVEQLSRAKARLVADGYLLWGAKGFEADDVIATATAIARSDEYGLAVLVVSSDKDLLQLAAPDVAIVSTRTGDRFGPEEVREKWGVGPKQIRDLLALMGDKSDNVPGVPRCGPKTAAKLLQDFETLEHVIDAADVGDEKIKPALCAAIREMGDALRVSQKLVTLATDAPLHFEELYQAREVQPLGEPVTEEELEEMTNEPTVEIPEPPPPAAAVQEPSEPAHEQPAKLRAMVRTGDPGWALALEPTNSKSAVLLARLLYESRMFGQFGNSEAILAIILRGRSLGLDSVTALSRFMSSRAGRPCTPV